MEKSKLPTILDAVKHCTASGEHLRRHSVSLPLHQDGMTSQEIVTTEKALSRQWKRAGCKKVKGRYQYLAGDSLSMEET